MQSQHGQEFEKTCGPIKSQLFTHESSFLHLKILSHPAFFFVCLLFDDAKISTLEHTLQHAEISV